MKRGGEQRSAARRAVRMMTMRGEAIPLADLSVILRGAVLDVRAGAITPSVALAIASLARAAVSVATDVELAARIEALERAAGIAPPTLAPLDRRQA